MKILKAKANNLESNLHIEIDMERLEDSSKALSFIGIEVSDALKLIPTPEDNTQTIVEEEVEPEVQNIEEVVETKKKAKKVKAKKEKGDVATNLNVEKDETTTIEYTNNYEENKVETKENKSDQTPKQESKKAKTGDDTQIHRTTSNLYRLKPIMLIANI